MILPATPTPRQGKDDQLRVALDVQAGGLLHLRDGQHALVDAPPLGHVVRDWVGDDDAAAYADRLPRLDDVVGPTAFGVRMAITVAGTIETQIEPVGMDRRDTEESRVAERLAVRGLVLHDRLYRAEARCRVAFVIEKCGEVIGFSNS